MHYVFFRHRSFLLDLCSFIITILTLTCKDRGGVEDIRLEAKAKAKDTKKFQGQGQTLSRLRPRTKDTVASVLQKKDLQKFFSGDLKEKKAFKIFFQAKKVFKIFFSGDLYLWKPKKGLCRFSARFLAFSNEILTVQK